MYNAKLTNQKAGMFAQWHPPGDMVRPWVQLECQVQQDEWQVQQVVTDKYASKHIAHVRELTHAPRFCRINSSDMDFRSLHLRRQRFAEVLSVPLSVRATFETLADHMHTYFFDRPFHCGDVPQVIAFFVCGMCHI